MTETPRDEPGLFDLPLDAPPPAPFPLPDRAPSELAGAREPSAPSRRASRSATRPETLPLFDFEPAPDDDERPAAATAAAGARPSSPATERARAAGLRPLPRATPSLPPPTAPLAARLRAAGGDLVVIAAIGAFAALGASWLGAPIGARELAPLALFLLAWSFVYFVVPLAFWGATPGMSWARIEARATAVEPLSFGQAALRWVGTWLTWATLGLAGLLALSGRSLTDRLSSSSTYPLAPGA